MRRIFRVAVVAAATVSAVVLGPALVANAQYIYGPYGSAEQCEQGVASHQEMGGGAGGCHYRDLSASSYAGWYFYGYPPN